MWEIDRRHELWYRYVDKYKGKYKVKIVKDKIDENEALWLEEDLMRQYGGQLVNWANLGLESNVEVNTQYWDMRQENKRLLDKANKLEKENLEKAIKCYRESLSKMIVYEKIDTNTRKHTGIAAKVYEEMSSSMVNTGNTDILSRLTICLKRLKIQEESVSAVKKYLEEFPDALILVCFQKNLKRAGMNEFVQSNSITYQSKYKPEVVVVNT